MGVGVGEAGGALLRIPSFLICILKKSEQALWGVYAMGIPIGIMAAYFVTAALIGASSDDVNWREIFVFLGVTGILLAVVVKLTIREPILAQWNLMVIVK